MAEQGDPWTGRVIDGRYEVETMLGQGGMGVVLKARHKFTGAQVALKMLQPDLQVNQEAKERFLAEARTPSTIGHPGIVQVLDAGLTPEGELYLAMELLTGRTLRQAMYPSVPPQVTRRVMLELCDALGAAHGRGIVHRDLKPENVFLSGPSQTVKLLDFGIAKVLQTTRTAAGAVLGTLSYMAPEQLTDASSVDARADLWAVGAMTYEMLAGRLPYTETQFGQMVQALATRDPDPISRHLPGATPAFDGFFARALARDRSRRFGSAGELAHALGALPLGIGPSPATTLTGLGARGTGAGMETAADSGSRSRTPPAAPPPMGAFAPATPPSQPFAVPVQATPFAPPGAPPMQPPRTPPPMQPGTPRPMAALPVGAPSGGFGSNPYGAPPRGSFPPANTPKPDTSLGKQWYFLGGVVAVILAVTALVTVKMHKTSSQLETCNETCSSMSACLPDTECQAACVLDDTARGCVADSNGSCAAYEACMTAAGREP